MAHLIDAAGPSEYDHVDRLRWSAGLFLLTSGPSGSEALSVMGGPGARWKALPRPPGGTATVAFGPGGTVDALVVRDTIFSDWAIGPGPHLWDERQVTKVPILFGSSQ